MWHLESKTEQPILSKELKAQEKLKEFRQYLVEKDVVLLIVKFLLSIKNSTIGPENLTQAFREFIGECANDNAQYEQLVKSLETEQAESKRLNEQIGAINQQIRQAKEQKARKQEEQRVRLQQEAQKKDSKKPGKK